MKDSKQQLTEKVSNDLGIFLSPLRFQTGDSGAQTLLKVVYCILSYSLVLSMAASVFLTIVVTIGSIGSGRLWLILVTAALITACLVAEKYFIRKLSMFAKVTNSMAIYNTILIYSSEVVKVQQLPALILTGFMLLYLFLAPALLMSIGIVFVQLSSSNSLIRRSYPVLNTILFMLGLILMVPLAENSNISMNDSTFNRFGLLILFLITWSISILKKAIHRSH